MNAVQARQDGEGYMRAAKTAQALLRAYMLRHAAATEISTTIELYERVRDASPEIVDMGITGLQWDAGCELLFTSELGLPAPEPCSSVTDAAGRRAQFIAAMEDLRDPATLAKMRAVARAHLRQAK